MMVLQNIKHRITIQSSNPSSGCTPKKIESRDLNRYLNPYVHSSMIHNSHKEEATEVSIDK